MRGTEYGAGADLRLAMPYGWYQRVAGTGMWLVQYCCVAGAAVWLAQPMQTGKCGI